jgi:signal transduction histidine kinase
MASRGPSNADPQLAGGLGGRLASLVSAEMLWLAWLPVGVIGVLHYATGSEHSWAHDVLRRLYYLPILFAAFSRGALGGLAVALVTSASYVPHAFFMHHHGAHDPASTPNKLLEIVLYNAIGLLAGILADREARRRREVERAMVEQQQMAEQLVRAGRLAALGELVAGIAHEIKNPLHTIKGTAEIVDEAIAEDAEQAPMWTLLRQEVERLERIAERFLSFARPQTPVLVAQPLAQAYDRVRELLEARVYESQGVRFEVAPLSSALAESELRVDRDQLAQLALNIAANAIRAMEGQGRLRLAVTPRDAGEGEDRGPPQVALTLENDGPTIPAEQLERIFDPFWTRAGDGTGLGLAIAERIAEAHGGTIEAHNTGDERGVAFSLVLPVSRAR